MCSPLIALCIVTSSASWSLVFDDDGIQVWAREAPSSAVHEVSAETIVEMPAARVWKVLGEVERYHEWMPYMTKTTIIDRDDEGQYEYAVVDPPVVSRRDYTVRATTHENASAGRYQRVWELAPNKGPPQQEGLVRMKETRGSWTLTALDPGRTKISYFTLTDPGGSIPSWVSNRANTSGIPKLLQALRLRAAAAR